MSAERDLLPVFDFEKDNEPVYDKQLAPMLESITKICKENNIPFIAAFQFQVGASAVSTFLPDGSHQNILKAARIFHPDWFFEIPPGDAKA